MKYYLIKKNDFISLLRVFSVFASPNMSSLGIKFFLVPWLISDKTERFADSVNLFSSDFCFHLCLYGVVSESTKLLGVS